MRDNIPSPGTEPGQPGLEEAMRELQSIVEQLESGELPLEASVAAYKRGSELVQYCAAQLERVEKQVKVLEGDMLKPFATDDEDEEEDEE